MMSKPTPPLSRWCRSERGSLPLALIVIIIVAGLIVVLVSRTLATQSQVRFDQGFHSALPVADAGVDLAKFWLNRNEELTPDANPPSCVATPVPASEIPVGCTVTINRTIDGKPYSFTLTRGSVSWEVDSTGIDPDTDVERRIVATFQESPLIDLALFAETFIDFGGGNQADSYTSAGGPWTTDPDSWCTRLGFVATNGSINFSGQSQADSCHLPNQRTVDQVFLYKFPDNVTGTSDDTPGGERCRNPLTHANCTERVAGGETWQKPETDEEPFELEGLENNPFISEALDYDDENGKPCSADTLLTSARNGVLDQGTLTFEDFPDLEGVSLPGDLAGEPFHCVDTLRFDTDTIVDPDADGPVIFIVEDAIIDGGGVNSASHVNCGGSPGNRCVRGPVGAGGASTPAAGNLWIFARDEIVLGNHSHVSAVLWGPGAKCDGGAQTDVYGSLICDSLPANLGGWRFHYDEELLDISSQEFRVGSWREEVRS